jgi:hypothetical protein
MNDSAADSVFPLTAIVVGGRNRVRERRKVTS